uniref:Uncharacterized protein n=1 Tax=Bacteriophage sp. TaxID=38018 RepID=A0A8D9UHR0_9VIRU|nr:MAG TPA: hypothetical protein [Bacteriophage sp.]
MQLQSCGSLVELNKIGERNLPLSYKSISTTKLFILERIYGHEKES